MKVAIRADASVSIGTGHVMRCRSLAHALQERGAQVDFLEESEIRSTDWIVVDKYTLNAEWETRMRGKAARIMVIDDLADRQHDCDVLLDQNYFPNAEDRYKGLVPERCRRLLGPHYALLRPEFARQRKTLRERDGRVQRVLVSLGGVDRGNETSNIISLLKPFRVAVDVVAGSMNPNADRIALECAQAGFTFHRQASNMAELMAAADLAIGAGGSTTWERCCLGLPTLQVAISHDQFATSSALASLGVIFFCGKSVTEEALRDVLSDPNRLKDQSVRMRQLVDGEGARRVAAGLFASARTEMSFRDAKADDAWLYFHWANDPEALRQSIDGHVITWNEHEAWFERRIADSVLLIAQDEVGIAAGQIRFQPRGERWRVNYYLAPEFRGVGLGAKMLSAAIAELRRRKPGARLTAEVKPDNVASRKVFARLGFKEVSSTMYEQDA